MATETLVPDGVISSSGLREATVGNLNADDGNWATAKSGTSNGSVLVSFPSPTSNLVLGTDLQTFNAKVRKNNTGTPTARIELWEAGGTDALAKGPDTPITSTVGQTISLTWNAALLTLISGADVEAKVVFTHVGSTSVDVGYIEWVDNFGGPATVGAVDGTLADIALSAVGALALTGTLAVALASLSLNGSGQKPTDHTGTSSVTLGSLTGTLTGALSHEGTVDATLGNVTLSSSGTIIQPTFDPVLNSGISAISWSYGKPDSVVRGAYTGARSSILNPWAPRWKAHVELPVAQGEAQARTIRSFIAQRTGRLVSFRLPATAVAQNNNTGVSLSSDAAKGATSISISGAATPLKDGQMISVNGQLLCCVADQSGSTLTFLPPLRAAATTGTIVVTSRPYARMFLANSASGWSVGARRLFKFTLDVEEAILVHDDPPPETLKNTGHLTKTLGALTLSSTALHSRIGSLAEALGNLSLSATGQLKITGSLAETLGSLAISATGNDLPITLDFTTASYQGNTFTTTRSGAAYAPDTSGNWSSFASGAPRITNAGILVEPGSENIIQNADLTNTTYWTGAGKASYSTATTNGLPLTTLTEDTSTGVHGFSANTGGNRPATDGGRYGISCFLKAGTRRYVVICFAHSTDSTGVIVDTVNWTIAAGAEGAYSAPGDFELVNYGGGLYRARFQTAVTTAVDTALVVVRGSNTSTYAAAPSYTGNGSTIIAGVPMMEKNGFSTSPIFGPTTRPPDSVKMNAPVGSRCKVVFDLSDGTSKTTYMNKGDFYLPVHLSFGRLIKKATITDDTSTAVNGVIVDTDIGPYLGDVQALQTAISRVLDGAMRLLGVAVSSCNASDAPCADALMRYAGIGNVPVGAYMGSSTSSTSAYAASVVPTWPSKASSRTGYDDAVTMYRKALAAEPDGSVVIVTTGSLTNVAALLTSSADSYSTLGGTALVTAKVKAFVIMGGVYPSGSETNFTTDPASANAAVTGIPSTIPIKGIDYNLGSASSQAVRANTTVSPFAVVYNAGGTSDQWDQMAVLLSCNTSDADFNVQGANGTNTVNASTGANSWSASPTANYSYMGAANSTDITNRIQIAQRRVM